MGEKKDKKDKNKNNDIGALDVIKKEEKKKKKDQKNYPGKVDFEAMREINQSSTRLSVSCGNYGGYPHGLDSKKKTNINISMDVPGDLNVKDVYNTPEVQNRITAQLDEWDVGKLNTQCSVDSISDNVTFPYEVIQNAVNRDSVNMIDTSYKEVDTSIDPIAKFDEMIVRAKSNGASSLKVTKF